MIVRLWRGQATTANADAYLRHVTETVFPSLTGLAGHRGAYLLRREVDDRVEFLAVTLWEYLEAIQAFAGHDIGTAVVEPQARAVLADADDFVNHFEVAFGDCR
jgi:hypothetical protein